MVGIRYSISIPQGERMKYLIVVVGLSSSAVLSMENPDHLFADAVAINAKGDEELPLEPSPEISQKVSSDETKSSTLSPTQAAQDTSAQKVESPKNPLPQISQIAHSDESTSPAPSPRDVISRATKTAQNKSSCYQRISGCFRRR